MMNLMSNEEFLNIAKYIINLKNTNNNIDDVMLFNDYEFYNMIISAKSTDLRMCLFDDNLNSKLSKKINVSLIDIETNDDELNRELFFHIKIQPIIDVDINTINNIILYNDSDIPVLFSNNKGIISYEKNYIDISLSCKLVYSLIDNKFKGNSLLQLIKIFKICETESLLKDNIGSIIDIYDINNDEHINVCVISVILQTNKRLFIKCVRVDDITQFTTTKDQELIKTMEIVDDNVVLIEPNKYDVREVTITMIKERV